MKTIVRTAAALAFAATLSAVAHPASAGEWRYGPYGPYYKRGPSFSPGAAAAVGVLGGLAAGAAIASSARAAPVYVERPAPVYVERRTRVIEEECFVERRRVWVPGWGWEARRRTVCE
jgi:hypothetical protein